MCAGILGDEVFKERGGVGGFMVGMPIAIFVCVLSNLFQVVPVNDVQLSSSRVGRCRSEGGDG